MEFFSGTSTFFAFFSTCLFPERAITLSFEILSGFETLSGLSKVLQVYLEPIHYTFAEKPDEFFWVELKENTF